MEKTTKYNQFKSVNSNREVDQRHVARLVTSIRRKNLLHINPILVDTDMRVIDGQHRLEAAKVIGVPIYYLVEKSLAKKDIATLNTNKKNWGALDYINYYTVERYEGFSVLSKFMAEHPNLTSSMAISLLSSNGRRNSDDLREGIIDVSNLDQATRIAEFLKWLRNLTDIAYQASAIAALRQMFGHDDFDEDLCKKKFQQQPRSLVKCVNQKQYLGMFLEIYNYQLSKNRLEL